MGTSKSSVQNQDNFSNWYPDLMDSPSNSDTTPNRPCNISDDEDTVMLASCNPKKRAGRKKFRETPHPVYRGIRLRDSGKWVCEVREPNKKTRIWLGTNPTADMAARAHDVAAIALRGRSACLNFADSSWRLPIPDSTDTKDIQKAAAEAAEAFRPDRLQPPAEVRSECSPTATTATSRPENLFYMEDDAAFEMPEYLANMAEGLMVPPPQSVDGHYSNDMDFDADVSLWSY